VKIDADLGAQSVAFEVRQQAVVDLDVRDPVTGQTARSEIGVELRQ